MIFLLSRQSRVFLCISRESRHFSSRYGSLFSSGYMESTIFAFQNQPVPIHLANNVPFGLFPLLICGLGKSNITRDRLALATYQSNRRINAKREITPHKSKKEDTQLALPQSRDDMTFDLGVQSTQGQSAACRARPQSRRDGFHGIFGIRGLGSERSAGACCALRPNFQNVCFFAVGERSSVVVVCFLQTSCHLSFY